MLGIARRKVVGQSLQRMTNTGDKLRSILSARSGGSIRLFSLSSKSGNDLGVNKGDSTTESADDFERRIFSDAADDDSNNTSFFKKLDALEKSRGRFNGEFTDRLDESFDPLQDGLDAKLKKAAMSFDYDEMYDDNYKYRPDTTFFSGTTYDIQDLDLTKPVIQKFSPKKMVDTTTQEVLEKADFRNVRFLAEFITEAGIIIKRSKTGISAKAQRKLAREIKTARAFGLMPFITMGTKAFIPGKSMKDDDPAMLFYDGLYNGRLDDIGIDAKEDRVQL